MADRTAPTVPDGLELRKDGTARLTIDGKGWVLRRPKLGEFRKLRTLDAERFDAIQDLLLSLGDELVDPGKDAAPAERRAYQRALTKRGRALEEATLDGNVEWLSTAFALLAGDGDALPDPDEWPAGLQSSDSIVTLLNHWRQVPLRSGGS